MIWPIIYPLIFVCCCMDTAAYAFTDSNLPLNEQYAISRAIGEGQQEYYIKAVNMGSLLENKAQDFTVQLHDDAGLDIRHQGHHIRMRLVYFGYDRDAQQLPPAHPQYSANQITFDHGRVKQWFINGPMGLQQGFTIGKRSKYMTARNFTLGLNVDSDLRLSVDRDEHGVSFVNEDGITVFKYSGLMVVDARQRQLPAYMKISKNKIRIVVDDRNAVYPVTVDPIFQQAKLTASDGAAGDIFAQSVAIDGNTIVIGAPEHKNGSALRQGIVYVFENISNHWTQTAKLTAHDGQYGDRLGKAVAIDGDVIVAGAPGYGGQGAAYIFVKPSAGWTNMTDTAKLTHFIGRIGDWFGNSVDIENDTVVVGAMNHDVSGKNEQGVACIFVKSTSGWLNTTEDRILKAENGEDEEHFGRSVAIDNNTIIVGSDAHAPGGQPYQGAVYVFEKPSSGWPGPSSAYLTQTAKLMASDGAEYDYLGYSVKISSDTIVAGAASQSLAHSHQGAAYIFTKSGAHWIDANETAKLTATDAMNNDNFGHFVAIDGDTIVVGAPYHNRTDIGPDGLPYYIPDMGTLYAFSMPSGGWHDMQTVATMISSDGGNNDHLGWSTAISGKTVVAGAPDHNISGNDDQGAAYVFRLKKKSPWLMFVSAITSHVGYVVAGNKRVNAPDPSDNTTRYKKYIGTMTLGYGNTMIPHFNESTDSFCTLWMPVNGNIGPLTCSPEVLNYDATEIDGNAKLRYKGLIHFQPTGTCNKSLNTCSVADGASGSETQWWWTWNGTSWDPLPGTPWTGALDGFGNTYNFNLPKVLSGGDTVSGNLIRTMSWKLWLMPAH